jgi:hypothetical protein
MNQWTSEMDDPARHLTGSEYLLLLEQECAALRQECARLRREARGVWLSILFVACLGLSVGAWSCVGWR